MVDELEYTFFRYLLPLLPPREEVIKPEWVGVSPMGTHRTYEV